MEQNNLQAPGGMPTEPSMLETQALRKPVQGTTVRRRRRKIISCEQCHRAKAKCDRKLPCLRCNALGRSDQCSYGSNLSTLVRTNQPQTIDGATSSTPCVASVAPEEYYEVTGLLSRAGLTNWAKISSEFVEARDFLFYQNPDFQTTYQKVVQAKDLFPSQESHNFPFGSLPSDLNSTDAIIRSLPSRSVVERSMGNYMQTFNVTHRLFHPLQVRRDIANLYDAPDTVKNSTLAQIFCMLSLSCKSTPQPSRDGVGELHQNELSSKYLTVSEAAFNISHVMEFPDLPIIQTLCMMVIGKIFNPSTPASSGGLIGLVGFLVRTAMSISLHRDPVVFPSIDPFEAEMRRRIWNVIVYIDLSIAIDSGMPPILRPGDWDTSPPMDANDNDIERICQTVESHVDGISDDFGSAFDEDQELDFEIDEYDENEPTTFTDATLQVELAASFETVSQVLSIVNSASLQFDYTTVRDLDTKLGAILHRTLQIFNTALTSPSPSSPPPPDHHLKITLQHTLFEAFTRRTLLALHQPFADTNPTTHAISHFAILDSSLAMLRAQHQLHAQPLASWFSELLQPEFACSMIYVVLALRRHDFPDADADGVLSARDTVWTALRMSYAITKTYAARSFHAFKMCFGLAICVGVLEAMERGVPLLGAAEEAVEDVVRYVRLRREPKS